MINFKLDGTIFFTTRSNRNFEKFEILKKLPQFEGRSTSSLIKLRIMDGCTTNISDNIISIDVL